MDNYSTSEFLLPHNLRYWADFIQFSWTVSLIYKLKVPCEMHPIYQHFHEEAGGPSIWFTYVFFALLTLLG